MRWLDCIVTILMKKTRRVIYRIQPYVFTRSHAQGLVEYGLILVLIAVACVAILTIMGQSIHDVWYSRVIPALQR